MSAKSASRSATASRTGWDAHSPGKAPIVEGWERRQFDSRVAEAVNIVENRHSRRDVYMTTAVDESGAPARDVESLLRLATTAGEDQQRRGQQEHHVHQGWMQ